MLFGAAATANIVDGYTVLRDDVPLLIFDKQFSYYSF